MPKKPAKQIRRLRLTLGLSQQRFGEKIGLSGKTISAYENERVIPPLKVLEKITNTYKTEIEIPGLVTSKGILERLKEMQTQLDSIQKNLD